MFARVAPLLAALLSTLVVAGCAKKPSAPPPPQVAFVASASTDAFNGDARAALERCAKETPVVLAPQAPPTADVETALVLFATEKVDTVIAIGYAAAPALSTVARRFEGTHFALIDAVADQPNVESITFDEGQGAFLAGTLAALVSKTHRVAFIGGADVPLLQRSEAGFTAGARLADPRTVVVAQYLASFTDAQAARRLADGVLSGGADVIFAVAGPAGRGVFAAVAQRPHVYAIGADTVQDAAAPGKILTSVVKHVDAAVLRVCLEAAGGKPQSGHHVLGLADGGIGLTDFAYTRAAVGAPTLARIDRVRADIIAGRIVVPETRASLARFSRTVPGSPPAAR